MIHTSWSDIKASRWALTRRASRWPLVRLVLLAFLAGVILGASIAFASSVLSASPSQGSFRPDQPADLVDVGSTVRASASSPEFARGPLTEEARGESRERSLPASESGSRSVSGPSGVTTPTRDDPATILALIHSAALEFGVDPARLEAVAFCESSLLAEPRVGQAQELGWFQWQPRTWEWLAAKSGLGYTWRDIVDERAQARLTAWAFANGYASHWTCAK